MEDASRALVVTAVDVQPVGVSVPHVPRKSRQPCGQRKKGDKTRKSKVLDTLIERVASGKKAKPLEVMLETMLWLRDLASTGHSYVDGDEVYTPLRLRIMAAEIAARAAPYMHARYATIGTQAGPVTGIEDFLRTLVIEDDSASGATGAVTEAPV